MLNRFQTRKQKILEQLTVPDEEYQDLSPKGSVDAPIRALIGDLNVLEGLVTTSSCSGRISVFLEGRKADPTEATPQDESHAGPGGKGGGGQWLYISHDPIAIPLDESSDYMQTFGLVKGESGAGSFNLACRYIHLKFEPMILHILTASLEDCQRVLTAALSAGFRESGAMSLAPSRSGELNPMVAVRSTGYSFDSIIGYHDSSGQNIALVDGNYLRTLVHVANERFQINTERIARFRVALLQQYQQNERHRGAISEWEDAGARKARKRAEGLARQQALKVQIESDSTNNVSAATQDGDLSNVFD
ncbi:hypothetical protein DPSP01_003420 [Paraphaeosphaeria sporulosa]|uniref:tRNA(Phe) 7-[(3-amino-3-carboxypropyl)-4-demethylwyosine(37)-N(4)]-methyltransferase n=1 Tax=Paraphaeosphaeria sporulosa TaxID=1460663 RepID=A0A177CE76_9PLEO|nr:uncharacterized protein CC84DRAFT_827499 [Paraphaeosphaeria sporulosa]OAG05109.1 hypothetical protein CC84DRAFT_827499 [Paraphaeosphaeria sporulosa]